MADPPPISAPSPASATAPSIAAASPQNPNPNSLHSPQIPPSPAISDLCSPQNPLEAAGALDFAARRPQVQAAAAIQQGLQRTSSVSRMNQFGAAAAVRLYGGSQMSFGASAAQAGQQQQQQQQIMARAAGMMAGGVPGGSAAMMAAHYGLSAQTMGQPRAKTAVQSAQFTAASAAQALQNMPPLGVMGTLGMNSSLRMNGPMSYAQAQRFTNNQIRQQQHPPQTALLSSQNTAGQNSPRATSLSQLSALPQSGLPSPVTLSSQQQQQFLKQMQSSMASPVSPSHQLQQRQQQYLQQLSQAQLQQKPMGYSQQQVAQFVQHSQMNSQKSIHFPPQLQQQLQQLQQNSQQSPRMVGPASQKPFGLGGAQAEAPFAGDVLTTGSSIQGSEATNRILGKRKIQDLVTQVDPYAKLDTEVEDVLLELADDFIDSVTTFSCSLAKHRKSNILEAKDVLFHLEKNWRMKVPGFSKEDSNNQRNSTNALMNSHLEERDAAAVAKSTNKLIPSNLAGDHLMKRPSVNTEQSPLSPVGAQMLQQVHRS